MRWDERGTFGHVQAWDYEFLVHAVDVLHVQNVATDLIGVALGVEVGDADTQLVLDDLVPEGKLLF